MRLRAGRYYFSRAIEANFSDNSTTQIAPNIVGSGGNATYLAFANGVDGLVYRGSILASTVQIADFMVMKGGYTGNAFGDLTGTGLAVYNVPHADVRNVRAQQWHTGVRLYDMQEFVATNLDLQFNQRGMFASVSSDNFSRPNAIQFINCKWGTNFEHGADILNPAALVFLGGSCESNSPQGHTVDSAMQWGIRLVFTDDQVEGTTAATFIGFYMENNVGPDIWYSNQYGPSGLVMMGSTVQRHQNDWPDPSVPAINRGKRKASIKFDTAGGFKQSLTLIGNGFRGFFDYTADASSPYVQIVNPADNPNIVDLANTYVDAIEAPTLSTRLDGMVSPRLATSGSYASDSAAATAGVPIGGIYRNGSALQIRTQ